MRSSVVALALLMTACRSVGTAATPSAEPAPDLSGTWELSAGTAVPIVEDHPITLTLSASELSGISACNQYFGRLSIDGGSISIDGLGGTDMVCEPPVMAAEKA